MEGERRRDEGKGGGEEEGKGRGRGQGVAGPPFRKFLDPPLIFYCWRLLGSHSHVFLSCDVFV